MRVEAPTIRAILLGNKISDSVRFDKALDTLNDALENRKIFNVEFNEMKDTLKRYGVESVCQFLVEVWLRTRDLRDYQAPEWYSDFSRWCDFNQAAGRAKRLAKHASEHTLLPSYIEVMKEAATLHNLINSVKPFIVKGRRPALNPVELDLTNTGICAICGRRQKLDDEQKIVHHGFKISNGGGHYFGCREGSCFGVEYKPYELSNEANLAYAPVLKNTLKGLKTGLASLTSGRLTTFTVMDKQTTKNKTLTKPSPEFDRELAAHISTTEMHIRFVESDIKANQQKIDNWKRRPLMYGGKKNGNYIANSHMKTKDL